MASSKQLIQAISRAVKDASFQKRSTDVYAQILTDAQDFITDQLEPIIKIDTTSVVLVAETLEYNMVSDFARFETRQSNTPQGNVSFGTNAAVPLKAVTTNVLDMYQPKWRSATSATPSLYYIEIVSGAYATIGIWPPPSATALTDFGAVLRLKYVPRSAACLYDDNSPFDNTEVRLRGLQYLLKLRCIWQISLEDQDLQKADRFDAMFDKEMEKAKDAIESTLLIPNALGFTPYGRNTL